MQYDEDYNEEIQSIDITFNCSLQVRVCLSLITTILINRLKQG